VVPLYVEAVRRSSFLVDEPKPVPAPIDWLNDLASIAVNAYLRDARIGPKEIVPLSSAPPGRSAEQPCVPRATKRASLTSSKPTSI